MHIRKCELKASQFRKHNKISKLILCSKLCSFFLHNAHNHVKVGGKPLFTIKMLHNNYAVQASRSSRPEFHGGVSPALLLSLLSVFFNGGALY